MREKRLKARFRTVRVGKNFTDDSPPALDFTGFARPPTGCTVHFFFALEGNTKTSRDRGFVEPAAVAAANLGVDPRRGRLGMDESTYSVEENRANAGGNHCLIQWDSLD